MKSGIVRMKEVKAERRAFVAVATSKHVVKGWGPHG